MSPSYATAGRMNAGEWFYGAKPWTPADAARRAAENGTTLSRQAAAPEAATYAAELAQRDAQIAQLKAAAEWQKRNDAAQLRALDSEVARLKAEVARLSAPTVEPVTKRKGVRMAGGLTVFGKHPQRPAGPDRPTAA